MRMLVPIALFAALPFAQQAPPPPAHSPAAPSPSAIEAASKWAASFDESLSGLLFRERYRQTADVGYTAGHRLGSTGTELTLEASVFLLQVPGRDRFVVYRDVYSAGGRRVTDHTERLQKLLTSQTTGAHAQAQRLTDASARYNLGAINRNVNTPTMAFEFLTPANLRRLTLREEGRETIDGLELVVIAFEETARPTLVRGDNNSDVPASGRYWIDPVTGAVPRAVLEFTSPGFSGRLEVRLARHRDLKTWVPVELSERWASPTSNASGIARYDRFQRLSVSTDEIVKTDESPEAGQLAR